MTPGTLPIRAQRWTPFIYLIDFIGYNFVSASFGMHVRLRPDAPGSALITLAGAASPAEGISATVVTTGGVPTSTVEIRIAEATLEGVLLNAGRAGEDVVLAYDLHITGGGLPKTRWVQGSFTIEPGVTQ